MTAQEKWGTDRDTHFDTARIKKQNAEAEPVNAEWKPVKPSPGYILINCFGAALLHMIIQAAIFYVMEMGTIQPDGAIVATIANASIGAWRVCWRFKV